MPGRVAIYDDVSFKYDILEVFGSFQDNIKLLNPRYNIAPTTPLPVFLNNRVYTYSHYRLIPSWAKDKKNININARSESLFEKVTFREPFKSKRCLVPINGYYEWKKDKLDKSIKSRPFFINHTRQNYFALAGLWDEWYDADTNSYILSCALVTTEPNETIEKLHDRMPVILDKKDWSTWLDYNSPLQDLNKFLKPSSSEIIQMDEVSDIVNSVANDSIDCLRKPTKIKMIQQTLFNF